MIEVVLRFRHSQEEVWRLMVLDTALADSANADVKYDRPEDRLVAFVGAGEAHGGP